MHCVIRGSIADDADGCADPRQHDYEDNYTIALLQRKLRWGEFLQRLRETVNKGDTEIAAEGRHLLIGPQEAHEAELMQRHAAAARASAALSALAAAGQSWAEHVRKSSPVFTNCMRFGYQGNMDGQLHDVLRWFIVGATVP
jgi:hypothetical protein